MNKIIGEGYTFDDVLLVPAYSEVLPNRVSIRTGLSRSIDLNIPLVSAAMDTVTESELAIAIAREGGIGEYLWRTLDQVRKRPSYIIEKIL